MPHIIRPRLRYALEMSAIVGLIAAGPFMIVALAGVLAPERFPFVLPLAGVLASGLPFAVLFPLLCHYAFERSKHWIIGRDGVELWKSGERKLRFSWDEVHSMTVATYTLRLQAKGDRRAHHLTYVDRKGVAELIPGEKLQLSSQL